MKTIIVACGGGIATSATTATKINGRLDDMGLSGKAKAEAVESAETSKTQEAGKKENKERKEKTGKQAEKQADADKPEPQKKPEKSKATRDIPPFLESYMKAYPKETAFHVTSDKQVFLGKDLNLARFHQRSLKTEGEVQTIKVK